MNLTEAERLVRRIESYLKSPDESLQPSTLAENFTQVMQEANSRIITCQRIIRGGDSAQALQLAEAPPAVLDLINCLAFRKSKDWTNLCQKNNWKTPEPVDREAVKTLQEAYAQGIKADHDFFKQYRGAVLRRDWKKAYNALESILKAQPEDEKYQSEAARLRKQILNDLINPLGKAVEQENFSEVLRLSDEIESLNFVTFNKTISDPIWEKSLALRCSALLDKAVTSKNSNAWQEALAATDQVNDLQIQYNLTLSPQMAENLRALRNWGTSEAKENELANAHASLVSELQHMLQLVEEKQTASVNLNLEERKLELDKLAKKWREIEVSGREVPEALQDRYMRIVTLLRGQITRKHRVRRNVGIAGAFALLIFAGIIVFFILQNQKASGLTADLKQLIQDRKVQASEALAKRIRDQHSSLLKKSNLAATLDQVSPFCEKEKKLKADLLLRIDTAASWAKEGFEKYPSEKVQAELDECSSSINNLAKEFQNEATQALGAVSSEWDLYIDKVGENRNRKFTSLLAGAETELNDANKLLNPQTADAAMLRITPMVDQLDKLLPSNLKQEKIRSDLVERFGVMTNKLANLTKELSRWKNGDKQQVTADQLPDYLSGIEEMSATKFSTEAQKAAIQKVLSLDITKDTLIKSLLLPENNQQKAWTKFKDNPEFQIAPSSLAPKEGQLLESILANPHISDTSMVKMQQWGSDKNLNQIMIREYPVFMFGELGRLSSNTILDARIAGAKVSPGANTDRLEWMTLYDPVLNPQKFVSEYRNLSSLKWKHKIIYDSKNRTKVARTPATHLVHNSTLPSLLTGSPETISGVYNLQVGSSKGSVALSGDGSCSMQGLFPGGTGKWSIDGIVVKMKLYSPEANETSHYKVFWSGRSLKIQRYKGGNKGFSEKFSEMSEEMKIFVRAGTEGGYGVPAGSLAKTIDKIHNAEDVNPLFKLYLLRKITQLAKLRLIEWDLSWLPESILNNYLGRLSEINISLKSGDWMVPELLKLHAPRYWAQQNKLSPTPPGEIEQLIDETRQYSFAETARLAYRMVHSPYSAGFSLDGYVSLSREGGRQLQLKKNLGGGNLWGWNNKGDIAKLYTWNETEKKHTSTAEAMSYSPVFSFAGNSETIISRILNDSPLTGFKKEETRKWLPPLLR